MGSPCRLRLPITWLGVVAACLPLSSRSWAAVPDWAELEATYALQGGAITADSGDESQSDRYLLTKRDYTDFLLRFRLTRLRDAGGRQRALVVFRVDDADRKNRVAFFLPVDRFPVGEAKDLQVVMLRDRASLRLEGEVISTSPTVYGEPPPAGKVGLLHYYDYAWKYEDSDLQELTLEQLPPPINLRAELLPSGAARLAWEVAPELESLLTFAVERRTPDGRRETLGATAEPTFIDRQTRSGVRHEYTVAAALGDDTGGRPAAVSIEVGQAAPPDSVVGLSAVLRLDNACRLRWRLPEESRAAGLSVLRAADPITEPGQGAVVARDLPLTATEFLAPASPQRHYAIRVEDPDGKQPAIASIEASPAAPPVDGEQPRPTKHPYLRYSAEQIAAARKLIAQHDWARRALEGLTTRADADIKTPFERPEEPDDAQRSVTPKLEQIGLAYALTEDEKYARYVRDVLLKYAQVYKTFEPRSGRARMTTSSGLFEATWYVPLVLACHYIWDSPSLSDEDRTLIETDLLRVAADLFWVRDYSDRADPRARDLHYKCYNFQAWFIAAVGLTGLLLHDADMLEHALDGPYGFKHLLQHDIHDDGLFWERSLGYHSFVLAALQPFLEACWHWNLDLYHLQVPDDYNQDREDLANYVVDGNNGPKSLKLMYDAPFYFAFPNLTYAVVADSSAGPLRGGDRYRIAWARYKDPKYAWLLGRERPAQDPGELYRGDEDASGTVRFAYDAEALYLSADIVDDLVGNTHSEPSAVWAGDALWIGLRWRPGTGGPYDFIYGLSPGNFGDVPPVPALFNRFATVADNRTSAAAFAAQRTPTGYRLEAAIPWAEFQPEAGEDHISLQPTDGQTITLDLVIYDGDPKTGPSTKDKMLCWSCVTDRYDSAQGGRLFFGPAAQAPQGDKVVAAPRVQTPPAVDAALGDWAQYPCRAAHIARGSAVLTDAGSPGANLSALFWPDPPADTAEFRLRDGPFCNNGLLQQGCSLFPSSGFVVLRETPGDDGLVDTGTTAANLNFGPHGGGHGHSDKLSLAVYANGRHWLPDFGSCDYDSPLKGQWTAQTVSHNTIVVDGVSMLPTGDRDVTWPTDTATSQVRGELDFFWATPLVKVARAHCDTAYPGVRLERTVALIAGRVVDFFRATSDEEHQYDYVLHIDGELADVRAFGELQPHEGPLGEKAGYQFITDLRRVADSQTVVTEWRQDEERLAVATSLPPPCEFFLGQSITKSADTLMPVAIARARAKEMVFTSIIAHGQRAEDVAAGLGQHLGREFLDAHAEVKTPEGDYLVVLRVRDGEVESQGLAFRGDFAVAKHSDGEASVALVHGTYAQWHGLEFGATQQADLLVTQRPGRRWEITVGALPPGHVRLKSQGDALKLQQIDGRDVPLRIEGDWVSFPAEPNRRYRLQG